MQEKQNIEVRFNEVTSKLVKMFKLANDPKKDELVKGLKAWVKQNQNTNDTGKIEAIKSFLNDNNIF